MHPAKLLLATSIGTVAACSNTPPPAAPEPIALHVSMDPNRVVTRSAQILTGEGWAVVVSDAPGGILRAEHKAEGDRNGDWIACENGWGRRGDRSSQTLSLTSTVSVHVVAKPDTAGSLVQITGTAEGKTAPMLIKAPVECVSSGSIERALADSLRAAS